MMDGREVRGEFTTWTSRAGARARAAAAASMPIIGPGASSATAVITISVPRQVALPVINSATTICATTI